MVSIRNQDLNTYPMKERDTKYDTIRDARVEQSPSEGKVKELGFFLSPAKANLTRFKTARGLP